MQILLTQGKTATIDARFRSLLRGSWQAMRDGSLWLARRRVPKDEPEGEILLHREVWRLSGRPMPEVVRHLNGNGLDCRLANLMGCTYSEKQALSPRKRGRKFIGVSRRPSGRYVARIGQHYLGTFSDPFSAAWVRDAAAAAAGYRLNGLADRRRRNKAVVWERRAA